MTNPGCEVEVTVLLREADYRPDDWLGLFKANQIINYFDSNPKSGSLFTLLPMLFTYFQNLMIAYYAPNRQNEHLPQQCRERTSEKPGDDHTCDKPAQRTYLTDNPFDESV